MLDLSILMSYSFLFMPSVLKLSVVFGLLICLTNEHASWALPKQNILKSAYSTCSRFLFPNQYVEDSVPSVMAMEDNEFLNYLWKKLVPENNHPAWTLKIRKLSKSESIVRGRIFGDIRKFKSPFSANFVTVKKTWNFDRFNSGHSIHDLPTPLQKVISSPWPENVSDTSTHYPDLIVEIHRKGESTPVGYLRMTMLSLRNAEPYTSILWMTRFTGNFPWVNAGGSRHMAEVELFIRHPRGNIERIAEWDDIVDSAVEIKTGAAQLDMQWPD